MNKSQRIRTTVGSNDKYLQIKLEQNTEFLEILSLKIDQNQAYQNFNADYGVIVGRVEANNSIGVPNAKISIFIPITDEDQGRPEIYALYPYLTPRDKNTAGKRYNLLPRVSKKTSTGNFKPVQPFGSFPPKEEILTNETWLEVYEKYYKFTTVTNNSGDYMIFGVPVGVQTVHMSVDITDIGQFSMTPTTMVSQLGYSPNLFDENGSRIKPANDLQDLPNIETQEIAVDVRPFWGDSENYDIGITRQDFRIRATLVASVIVFGAGFTDGYGASYGSTADYFSRADDGISAMGRNVPYETANNSTSNPVKTDGVLSSVGMVAKRNGEFEVQVWTIPNRISDADIAAGNFDTGTDITLMDETQYSVILEDGMFLLTLPCNRTKKVTNELGELIPTTDDDPNGIYTELCAMFIVDYGPELLMYSDNIDGPRTERERPDRTRLKIPQYAPMTVGTDLSDSQIYYTFSTERAGSGSAFGNRDQNQRKALNEVWRKQNYRFTGGKLYSVAQFHGSTYEETQNGTTDRVFYTSTGYTGSVPVFANNIWRVAGGIALTGTTDASGLLPNSTGNYSFQSIGGLDSRTISGAFVGEWLNMCLYFPQVYNNGRTGDAAWDISRLVTTDFFNGSDMTTENTYRVVGFRRDLSYFLRSDLHPATFIEVPISDIVKIIQTAPNTKGLKRSDFNIDPLTGGYLRKGTSPFSEYYIYRGLAEADVIAFLVQNGIISA